MNKPGTKVLCSQRCYLRKLEISDSQQLFKNVYSDPKVAGYMSWNLYNNVTEVENYLKIGRSIINRMSAIGVCF